MLAAYYSQAKDGKNVPVDYTPIKYVHKPNGAVRAWSSTPLIRPPM